MVCKSRKRAKILSTKRQLAKRLELIAKHLNDDPEVAHLRADEELLNHIANQGVTDAWNLIKKHYA